MEGLIATAIGIFLLLFIIKIGSKLWRILGIVLFIGFIWLYREEISLKLNEWAGLLRSGDLLHQLRIFLQNAWYELTKWFGNLVH